MSSAFLTGAEIVDNIKKLQAWLKKNDVDHAYISSFDPYLNEYVPLTDCHRYYFSGFTGSVAELLIPFEGKVQLFVDGRYFEQADKEVNMDYVQVVKCQSNTTLFSQLIASLKRNNAKSIAMEADRVPYSCYQAISDMCLVSFFEDQLSSLIKFHHKPKLKSLLPVPDKWRTESTADKIARLNLKSGEAFYVSPLDSIAWLSNYRGHHLPHLASFYAKGIIIEGKFHVFVPEALEVKEREVSSDVVFHFVDFQKSFYRELKNLISSETQKLYVDLERLTASDYHVFAENIGKEKVCHYELGLYTLQSIKTSAEIKAFKESFFRADKAIVSTIKWVKEQISKGISISERDIYEQTTKEYQGQGAYQQSFNTISGVGENGSLIHYSNPKKERLVKAGEVILLDSGAYFEAGLATDTTRTFVSQDLKNGAHNFSEFYTLVLKGHIRTMKAIFPEGTLGSALDMLAREALLERGYNYQHGTGHGVGVHVHEPGVRISPSSTLVMKAGQVVSIEPGVYIPEVGGVRLESIAHVMAHPEYEGMLCFENLVYIGFEPSLINLSLLDAGEKKWLKEYEQECQKRGNDFGVLELIDS